MLIFYAITLALAVAAIFVVPWIGQASNVVTMLTWIAPEGDFRKALSLLGRVAGVQLFYYPPHAKR